MGGCFSASLASHHLEDKFLQRKHLAISLSNWVCFYSLTTTFLPLWKKGADSSRLGPYSSLSLRTQASGQCLSSFSWGLASVSRTNLDRRNYQGIEDWFPQSCSGFHILLLIPEHTQHMVKPRALNTPVFKREHSSSLGSPMWITEMMLAWHLPVLVNHSMDNWEQTAFDFSVSGKGSWQDLLLGLSLQVGPRQACPGLLEQRGGSGKLLLEFSSARAVNLWIPSFSLLWPWTLGKGVGICFHKTNLFFHLFD